MKIKTSELTGAALDWAVAKCEGRTVTSFNGGAVWVKGKHEFFPDEDLEGYDFVFSPRFLWEIGGPIIEREKIDLMFVAKDNDWIASRNMPWVHGPTPLIAAMRCLVVNKLGDEVEIPEELK